MQAIEFYESDLFYVQTDETHEFVGVRDKTDDAGATLHGQEARNFLLKLEAAADVDEFIAFYQFSNWEPMDSEDCTLDCTLDCDPFSDLCPAACPLNCRI